MAPSSWARHILRFDRSSQLLKHCNPGMASTVLAQLRRRNVCQSLQFRELVKSNTELLLQANGFKEQNARLQQELASAKAKNSELSRNLESGLVGPKYVEMQNELTALSREKAGDKQQITSLNEQVKTLHSTVTKQADELIASREALAHHKEGLREKQMQLEEIEKARNVTADECLSKSVEIERLREQISKLDSENAELLQRIKGIKEDEAEKHNEMLRLNEEIDKKKRSAENATNVGVRESPSNGVGMVDALTGREKLLSFGSTLPSQVKSSILAHPRAEIHTLAHNASGSMLVTGSDDRTVKLWDSRNGTNFSSLEIAVKAVMCVCFSGDGNLGLAASGDLSVRVWSLKTSRVLHTLTGHTGKIYTARFTPDSKSVFSSGHDHMIKLWDLGKGMEPNTMDCRSPCSDAAISREGAVITSVHLDAWIRFWDVRQAAFAHELSGVHSQPITSALTNPQASHQLLTNARDNTLCLIDTRNYGVVRTYRHASYKNGVNWNRAAISPYGQYVAAGGSEGGIFIWDLASGDHVTTLLGGHTSALAACSWGDNDQLASVEKEYRLVLWE